MNATSMRPIANAIVTATVMWLATTTPLHAWGYVVTPDGTGDFPTIQAAISSELVVSEDVIELTDGVFTGDGNRDLDFEGKAITLRSQSGRPDQCVIDIQGTDLDRHQAIRFVSGERLDSVVQGIGFENGFHALGAAIYCDSSSPTISDCVFSQNRSTEGRDYGTIFCYEGASPIITGCLFLQNIGELGSAVVCFAGATPTFRRTIFTANRKTVINIEQASSIFERCSFLANYSTVVRVSSGNVSFLDCDFVLNRGGSDGAVSAQNGSTVAFTDCLFRSNVAERLGGAIKAEDSSVQLDRCVLSGNRAGAGGALHIWGGDLRVTDCTIVENSAWMFGAGIRFSDALVRVERTIIAFSSEGAAITGGSGSQISLSCCDLYGNAGGDWVDGLEDQLGVRGNIWADPQFCDPSVQNFGLSQFSPCLPGQHPAGSDCGLMGAVDVTCVTTPTEETSWARIKERYRE